MGLQMKGTGLSSPNGTHTKIHTGPHGPTGISQGISVAVRQRWLVRMEWRGDGRPLGEEQEERPAGAPGCRGRFCRARPWRNPG